MRGIILCSMLCVISACAAQKADTPCPSDAAGWENFDIKAQGCMLEGHAGPPPIGLQP